MSRLLLYFVGLGLILEYCHCGRMLKIIPGVPTLTYFDPHIFKDVVFTTRRYSRKSEYVVNIEFTSKVVLGHNVTVSFFVYEYLHNEYRRSFVELHYNLCNLILKDALIGAVIRKVGFTVCPLPVGRYQMLNLTFDQEFPNMFPFEKGKGELVARWGSTKKLIAQGDLVLTFKQRQI